MSESTTSSPVQTPFDSSPQPDVPIAEAQVNAEPLSEDVADPEPEAEPKSRQQLLTECYTEATRELRELHQDEFNELRLKQAKARGVDWTPPLSKQDRAKAAARKTLEEAGLPIPAELA